jgi:hypothetical protein
MGKLMAKELKITCKINIHLVKNKKEERKREREEGNFSNSWIQVILLP